MARKTRNHRPRGITRREFLGTGIAGSIAVGVASAQFAPAHQEPGHAAGKSAILTARDRKTLAAAIDEIIPEGDGMPSASQVGGVHYLDQAARQNPGIAADLHNSLDALNGASQKRFGKGFTAIEHKERVQALSSLEQSDADTFNVLRDHVYESYYTQPAVWKRIGYDFHPTNEGGPTMKPFDETVLAEVRKKPKYYREVP